MKVKIILKKPAVQKLALTKIIYEHTGMTLTDAKLSVDSLHQIPYQPQEFNLSNSKYREPVKSFLDSLKVIDLEYVTKTIQNEREIKMMELGIAEHEDYISFLSGQNPIFEINTSKVAKLALEKLKLEDLKEIFSIISKDTTHDTTQ